MLLSDFEALWNGRLVVRARRNTLKDMARRVFRKREFAQSARGADEGRVELAMQPPETNPAKPDDSGLTALVGFANGLGAALISES
jgi:hypothetical protein